MRLPGNGISRQRQRHRNTLTQIRCRFAETVCPQRIGPICGSFPPLRPAGGVTSSPSVCLRRSSFPRDGITSQRQGLASLTCRQLHWNRVQHFFEHYKDLEPGKAYRPRSAGPWAGLNCSECQCLPSARAVQQVLVACKFSYYRRPAGAL